MEGKQYESGMDEIYACFLNGSHLPISLRFMVKITVSKTKVTEPQNRNPESPPTVSITLLERIFPIGVEPIFKKE